MSTRPTDAEKRECMEILLRIWEHVPGNYADLVEEELRRQGVYRTRRQIYRARGMEAFDVVVMRVLEKVSRPPKLKKIKSVAEFRNELRRQGL